MFETRDERSMESAFGLGLGRGGEDNPSLDDHAVTERTETRDTETRSVEPF